MSNDTNRTRTDFLKLSKFASVRNHIIYLADCLLNDSLDNHDNNYYFTIFLLMKSLAKEICCFRSCAFFKLCTTIFGMFNEWIFWNRHLDFILLQVRSKTLSPHDGMYGNSENNSSPALSLVIDLIIFTFMHNRMVMEDALAVGLAQYRTIGI